MVKLQEISASNGKKITVSLFCDDKNEVVDGMTVEGLPDGVEMDGGSSVITASGELAFLKSDGTWNWLS